MLLIPMFLLVGVAVFVNWYFDGPRWARRQLAAAPRTAIGDAVAGQVASIVGVTAKDSVLRAPATGRECVYYELWVWVRLSKGWRDLVRAREHVPFVIADDSGRALIDLRSHAQISLVEWRNACEQPLERKNPAHRSIIERYDLDKRLMGDERVWFRETIIRPGQRIAAVGQAVEEPDPDGADRMRGYRSDPPMRLRFVGTARRPLVVSDGVSDVPRSLR